MWWWCQWNQRHLRIGELVQTRLPPWARALQTTDKWFVQSVPWITWSVNNDWLLDHCEHCKRNLQSSPIERLVGSIIELEPQKIQSQSMDRSQDLADSAVIIFEVGWWNGERQSASCPIRSITPVQGLDWEHRTPRLSFFFVISCATSYQIRSWWWQSPPNEP